MSDLINREALLNTIRQKMFDTRYDFELALDVIKTAPAVDAAPVVHGEWVARDDDILYCSNCRAVKPYDVTDGDSISYWSGDWCRHCGAKMNGGDED